MINVSNDFKNALTQPRIIDAKITYGNNTITSDNINSIKRSFNSELFKTIAKVVDIDSNTPIEKDTTINVQGGIYVDDGFEYLSLGNYKVLESPTMNKDTNSYQMYAYDKIVNSMVLYDLTSNDITYPCTVRDLFVAIFTKLNWNTTGIPATFVNSTSVIESDVYSNMNMTYRDVLDELCTITCMFLVDKEYPKLIQKTTTSEVINEEYISDTSVEVKEQVFFNSLVFSRVSDTDNIYRKDDESIAENGLKEYKVRDLQILSLNWRGNFIDEMWNYLKTFTYYSFDINTYGIMFLEPVDEFTLSIFNNTYDTILLNSDLTIGGGINEKIYSNKPKDSETEYKYASEQDKRNGQTTLIVDKRLQKIESEISNMPVITTENEGIGQIQLQDLASVKVAGFRVHPTNQDILGLLASNTLIASNSLIVRNREIVFKNGEFKAQFDLPPLYYYNSDIYDEFVYDAVEERAYKIQRVQVDSLGNKSILNTPIEIDYEYKDIQLEEGNYNIYVATCPTAYIYAKGMLKNEYTKTFATSYEVDSKITQTANQINARVREKVDNSEVVASLNLAIEEGQGIVELKGNSVIIDSDNFKLDQEGNIDAGGYITTSRGIMTNLQYVAGGITSNFGSFYMLGYLWDGLQPITFEYADLFIECYIPPNFEVVSANIVLSHTVLQMTDFDDIDHLGYAHDIRVYKAPPNTNNAWAVFGGGESMYSAISNSELGTPLAIIGNPPTTNELGKKDVIIAQINKDDLPSGDTLIVIRGRDSYNQFPTTYPQLCERTGLAHAVLNIMGYMKITETPQTIQTPLLGGGLLGGELNQNEENNEEPLNVGEPMNTNIEEESDI